MESSLPPNCFISHSYQDAASREQLIAALPPHVTPFIFPPISVSPSNMVSNSLIEAILAQDALIVLEEGFSSRSFWVAFERDYALRSGKPVFTFTPSTAEFRPLTVPPMNLSIFPSFGRRDHDLVRDILNIMRLERYFELSVPDEDMSEGPFRRQELINDTMYKTLNSGGYVVVFWSSRAEDSKLVERELERAFRYFPADDPQYDRIIFALLDDHPLPAWYLARLENYPTTSHAIYPVQLYPDSTLSLLNRIDNLIVQLYWLIYRTTTWNHLD